jgi:riboflavin synthase
MFTGIIEALGEVVSIRRQAENLHLTLAAPFTSELKIDQSLAHNGTCLTVVAIESDTYTVTAISETLEKTNLGDLQVGDVVNLERCMLMGGRLDGHIVQGHVDMVGTVTKVMEDHGSWRVYFAHPVEVDQAEAGYVTVPKGSITVNGVSLTVVDSTPDGFSVAIIPYTWEHTNFHTLQPGSRVNLEFDIIGKYVSRMITLNQRSSVS